MEHVIISSGGSLTEDDVVPFVASDEFRKISFLDGCRAGPSMRDMENWVETTPAAVINCFLQTWLFFAIHQEILGDLFKADDYIVARRRSGDDGSSGQILDTSKLAEARRLWSAGVEDGRSKAIDEDYYHAIRYEASRFDLALNSDKTIRAVEISIKSSIALLLDVVRKNPDTKWLGSFSQLTDLTQTEMKVMRKNGWCPFDATRNWKKFRTAETQMLLRTSRRPVQQQLLHDSHDRCTTARCLSIQIDPTNFRPIHTSPHCECEVFSFDESVLEQIVRSGRLPLLRLGVAQQDDDHLRSVLEGLDLAMIAADKREVPFAAISHVWSDGLANPLGDGLPRCQLASLSAKVRLLGARRDGVHHFWIDSICIPTRPLNLRLAMISRMQEIYSDATAVLVLDANLTAQEAQEMSLTEKALLICTCRWSLRLWTLQEGLLARKLFFYFADGLIDVDSLILDLAPVYLEDFRPGSLAGLEVWMQLFRITRGFHESIDPGAFLNLENILQMVNTRSLSVPSDEPLCLLVLLGEQTMLTEGEQEDHSMAFFWKRFVEKNLVRPSIVFLEAPRIDKSGFRWAPKSLLYDNYEGWASADISYAEYAVADARTHLDPRGLLVHYAGLILGASDPTLARQIEMQDAQHGPGLPWMIIRDQTRQRWLTLAHHRPGGEQQTFRLTDSVHLAVILQDPDDLPTISGCLGLLVSIVETILQDDSRLDEEGFTDDRRYVETQRFCQLWQAGPYVSELFDKLYMDAVSVSWGDPIPVVQKELANNAYGEFGSAGPDAPRCDETVDAFVRTVSQRFRENQFLTVIEHLPDDHAWIVD